MDKNGKPNFYIELLKVMRLSIKAEPVETLKEILLCFSKEQLYELCDQALNFPSGKFYNEVFQKSTKKELCEMIEAKLLENAANSFTFMSASVCMAFFYIAFTYSDFHKDDEEAESVRDFCKQVIKALANLDEEESEKNDDSKFEEIIFNDILMLQSLGFVFCFNYNGKLSITVPDEIFSIAYVYFENFFDEIENDMTEEKRLEKSKEDFHFPGKFCNLAEYTKILTSLYGICDANDILNVYNRDFPKKQIQKEEFESYAEMICSLYKKLFYIEGEFCTEYLFLDEAEKARIREARKPYRPYIPSKEEILSKDSSLDVFNDESEDSAEFFDFIATRIADMNASLLAIDDSYNFIRVDKPLQFLYDYLHKEYGMVFETKDDGLKFIEVYGKISASTNLWSAWGHTLKELSKTRQIPRLRDMDLYFDPIIQPKKSELGYYDYNKATKTFEKPSLKFTTPIRKVGRNEPCPCGSGKKYKHCCGR